MTQLFVLTGRVCSLPKLGHEPCLRPQPWSWFGSAQFGARGGPPRRPFLVSLQLLYMCGGLLERPLILAEVVPRYSVMLELFDAELDNTKILYDTQIAASADGNIPPIHKNMPPVAGQLKWSLELQERLETPMRDLRRIDHP